MVEQRRLYCLILTTKLTNNVRNHAIYYLILLNIELQLKFFKLFYEVSIKHKMFLL